MCISPAACSRRRSAPQAAEQTTACGFCLPSNFLMRRLTWETFDGGKRGACASGASTRRPASMMTGRPADFPEACKTDISLVTASTPNSTKSSLRFMDTLSLDSVFPCDVRR